MFSLVRFPGNSYGIYHTKKIFNLTENGPCVVKKFGLKYVARSTDRECEGPCIVKHNGCKYEAFVIARDDSKDFLKKIQQSRHAADTTLEESTRKKPSERIAEVHSISSDHAPQCSTNMKKLKVDLSKCSLPNVEVERLRKKLKYFYDSDISISNEKQEEINKKINSSKEFGHSSDSDADPNYVPNEAENEYDEYEDEDNGYEDENQKKNVRTSSQRQSASFSNDRSSLGFDLSLSANKPGISSCIDENMYVAVSEGRSGDNKFNFCVYCNKKQKKIARHLESIHSKEEEVKKILMLPKGSQERRILVGHLRKKGNFVFNTNPQINDGELIVSRRPNPKIKRTPRDYMPCGKCKAYFSKLSLRAHFTKCTGLSSLKNRMVLVTSRKMAGKIHFKASDIVRQILFPIFRDDDVVNAIRYDELLIIYANKMCEKYKESRHFEMIRQRIRLLGRFLLKMRELEKDISDFNSIYDPKYIDSTMRAMSSLAQFDHRTKCFKTPSIAFSLGSLLKQIGNIMINECIKKHDENQKKNSEYFLRLLVQEVNISVNRTVVESQVQHRRRKVVELPLMEDIKKLYEYLLRKRNSALTCLKKQFSRELWIELASVTLISTQLFNRRRAGEVERILIDDFKVYQGIDKSDQELYSSLSEEGRKMAEKYVRFGIRGKLNRTVSVLLNDKLLECIKTLLEYREQAKVNTKNAYVFGIGRSKYLRACPLLRQYSSECGARYPERLRGTQLRKHIATKCLSLNLSENEYDELADFMGHAKNIHKNIYRQSQNSEILKMSKLLEIAQGVDDSSGDEDSEYEENGSTTKEDNISCESNKKPVEESSQEVRRKRSTSPYGHVQRRKWSSEERECVLRVFEDFIKINKLPPLKITQEAINSHSELQGRTVPQIRTWLHNQMKKTKFE